MNKMAEQLFYDALLSHAGGNVILRVYYDDLLGRPSRAEMQNPTNIPYRYYIGLQDRSVYQIEVIGATLESVDVLSAVQLLIDVRCDNGAVGCVGDWMCGMEGY